MKRFFVDANIILDALLERADQDATSAQDLMEAGALRKVMLLTSPLSIGVVLYQYQRKDAWKKGPGLARAKGVLADVLACVTVVPMDERHFLQSAASSFGDIEDGAQYFAVAAAGPLDGVVSRDPDFDGHIAVKRLSAAAALKLAK